MRSGIEILHQDRLTGDRLTGDGLGFPGIAHETHLQLGKGLLDIL